MEAMTDSTLLADIADSVRSVARIPPDVEITGDSLLVEDLAIDSLDLVGIFLKIQDDFDVAINDDDVASLRRVADLAQYVARHRGAAAA
jgi:acyl carrier protein